MKDKEARERIDALEKQLHEIKWELKHQIYAIQNYLGVKEETRPSVTLLVKDPEGITSTP